MTGAPPPTSDDGRGSRTSLGLVFGVALGVVIGAVLDDIAIGIGIGIAIGIAASTTWNRCHPPERSTADHPHEHLGDDERR